MKRFLLFILLTGAILLFTGVPAFAGTGVVSGTLTSANTFPNGRFDGGGSCSGGLESSGTFYYQFRQLQVSVSGSYDYSDYGVSVDNDGIIDAYVGFYTGSASTFDPTNPYGNGCVTTVDDSGSFPLTAGVTYTVVVSSYEGSLDTNDGDNNVGNYQFTLSGPGEVTVLGGSASNPMLSDGRINGQQGAPVILYCQNKVTHGLDTNGQVLFDVENGKSASGAWGSIAPTADGRMLLTSAFPDTKPYYFIYEGCDHGHYFALSGDPAVVFDSGSY